MTPEAALWLSHTQTCINVMKLKKKNLKSLVRTGAVTQLAREKPSPSSPAEPGGAAHLLTQHSGGGGRHLSM